MKSKLILILFAVAFILGCSENKRPAPSVLLDEPQMVDVMTDVQLMEGIISFKKNANQKTTYLKVVGYDTIFAHYGITDSIFEDNIRYYNEVHPLVLERIMDSVVDRLARMKN